MRSWKENRLHAVLIASAVVLAACTNGSDSKDQGAEASAKESKNPVVILKTNKGTIEIELYPDKAPKTVKNFLAYVEEGFYDGTIFHRVIDNFMIQGGGYTSDLKRKNARDPVPNEANNGLKNERGTIAMARTSDPHSATSQFFINVKDNPFLDFKSESPQGWGYAVFGRVVSGMQVVDAIEHTPTLDKGGAFANLPEATVIIESASVKKAQ